MVAPLLPESPLPLLPPDPPPPSLPELPPLLLPPLPFPLPLELPALSELPDPADDDGDGLLLPLGPVEGPEGVDDVGLVPAPLRCGLASSPAW